MHMSLACDSHIHITPEAGVEQYRHVQKLIGTKRAVVVQARPAGTDNTFVLDAIAQLGIADTRGVAVVHPDVSERELHRLHEGGIRAVRLSLYTQRDAVVSFEMTEALAERIRSLGWHLQLHWTADQIAQHASMLLRLQVPLVFDHMARLPPHSPHKHPAFATLRELVLRGNTWVKLSGPYLCTQEADGQYLDVESIAQAWFALAPDRLLWGSDWPHITEVQHKPRDTFLFDLLARWIPEFHARERILIHNPNALYGFSDLPIHP
jgi:D-galactarolactone isomerase